MRLRAGPGRSVVSLRQIAAVRARTGRDTGQCDVVAAKRDAVSVDDTAELRDRFMLSAAINRHLRADPLLPAALLPDDWPGSGLRHEFGRICTDFITTILTFLEVHAA